MLRTRDIRRRFDRAAREFDDADFVHAATREGIVSRLAPVLVEVASILDLGSATGAMGRLLGKRFRRARTVSLDLSHAMLTRARRQKPWLAKAAFVQAQADRLPFADASFDLAVANQLLPWIPQPETLFGDVARVLRKGGCFAFATLGPDSLQELRGAWAAADASFGDVGASFGAEAPPTGSPPTGSPPTGSPPVAHVHSFADMHDIGDGLVRAGLCDPVLDVDRLSLRYASTGSLFDDLTRAGARNALAGRSCALTGRARFRAMVDALENATAGRGLSLELELIYGHCWGGGPAHDPGVVRVAANRIPLRR